MERMSLLLYLLAKARILPDSTPVIYTFVFEEVNLRLKKHHVHSYLRFSTKCLGYYTPHYMLF